MFYLQLKFEHKKKINLSQYRLNFNQIRAKVVLEYIFINLIIKGFRQDVIVRDSLIRFNYI